MGDFKLIANKECFEREARAAWGDIASDDAERPHDLVRLNSPMLMAFYVVYSKYSRNVGQLARITCFKEDAKRIVYPKTNRNRRGNRIFSWVSGNMEEEISNYVFTTLRVHRTDPSSQKQKAYTDEIMRKSRESVGPGLISYRKYLTYPDRSEVINFFLLTVEKARELVYYNNNIKKKPKKKGPALYSVVILNSGLVQLSLLDLFNTQVDIPRFTAVVENELTQWETETIAAVNSHLASMPLDTHLGDRVNIARDEFDKFFHLRQYQRADYAVRYPGAWVNNVGRPDINILLNDARKRAWRNQR